VRTAESAAGIEYLGYVDTYPNISYTVDTLWRIITAYTNTELSVREKSLLKKLLDRFTESSLSPPTNECNFAVPFPSRWI